MTSIAACGRMAQSAGKKLAILVLLLAAAAAIWSILASTVFLMWMGRLRLTDPMHRLYAWFTYAPYYRHSMKVFTGLASGGMIATAPFLSLGRWQIARLGGWSGITRRAVGIDRIVRGSTYNHGNSDWMPIEQARRIFDGPCPEIGGIVVGEADRVDLGPAASVRFDPKNRSTWGNGGSAALLIDRCEFGSTHSIVIAGSGGFKTTSLATSILTWRKSRVVMDPSTELGPMLRESLEEDGQTVYELGVGSQGFNAISWIDPADPLAETKVYSVISRIASPEVSSKQDKNKIFEDWGQSIATALLMHMIWDDTIDPDLRTLKNLRAGLVVGEEMIKEVLKGIADTSKSNTASDIARSIMKMPVETFGGAYGHIVEVTKWLSTTVYADLVSGDAFNPMSIVDGKTTVFLQLPFSAMDDTPAVARTVIGGLLNSVFEADGAVDGRVAFFLDEAALLGPMKALKTARDFGRKYRVTLQLYYQSEGQIEEVWGKPGKDAWYDGVSWRSYAGIQNLNTARDLSASLGTFGAQATSQGQNTGKQSRFFEMPSSSSGANTSRHEISRELMKPAELLQDMRTDERITLIRNEFPIRHGAAIGFRRPEIASRLGDNRFAP